MRKHIAYIAVLLFVLLFSLSACERSQSTPPPPQEPSATPGVLTQLPDALASQTAAPTTQPTAEPPTPTDVPEQPVQEPPTATATPTDAASGPTLEPLNKTAQPDQPTQPATSTPSGSAFNPTELYGDPTMVDPMDSSSIGNWKSSGVLPNSDYIQIYLDDDQINVTGKKPGFSTWFFSWPTLKNFNLRMSANSGACSGKDEYGLIVRGPAHGAGVSYGYIIAFSCDGNFRVTRLNSADSFSITDLVSQRQSDHIQTGANQKNVIDVKAQGSKLTIYANGYQIAEVSDSTFFKGRYGLFVQGVETVYYTYQPLELAYWVLDE
jgi:hypothetical protein